MGRTFNREEATKQQAIETENMGKSDGSNFINIWKYDSENPLSFMKFKLDSNNEPITMELDIIPHEVTPDHPQYKRKKAQSSTPDYVETIVSEIYVHPKVGPADATVYCPKQNEGKPCPICDEYEKMKAELGWDHEDVKSLRAKNRGIVTAIDRSDEDKVIQIIDRPLFWFGKNLTTQAKQLTTNSKQICLFDISDDGHYVTTFAEVSKFSGRTFAGENKTFSFDKREKGTGYEDSVAEEAPKIGDWLIKKSYDEIKAIMDGDDFEEEEASDEEDRAAVAEVKEEPKEEVPVKKERKRRERKPKAEPKLDVCPYGLEFGTDNLTDDACDKCEMEYPAVCKACTAKYEEMEADS